MLHLNCSIVCCTLPCLFKMDMHHTWLCNMPCLCLFVYYVVCFFPVVVPVNSCGYLAILRIRSTTPVRLVHGFSLLPSGISGKMTVTLYLTTIFAFLVVSMLSLCHATRHLFLKPPKLRRQPLTFSTTQKTIVWLCYRFAQPLL